MGRVGSGLMVVVTTVLAGVGALVLALFLLQPAPTSRDLVDPDLQPDAAAKVLLALSDDARKQLIARETNQLLREPLDLEALSNLAVLKSLDKDQVKADAMVLESAARSLRATQTQVAAIRIFIAANDYAKAMYHVDGLLTAQPAVAENLIAGLLQLPDRDKLADALAGVLRRDPPWRPQFMTFVSKADPSGVVAYKVFGRLKKTGGGVTDDELRLYLDNQLVFKNHERAYFVWLDMLPDAALQRVDLLFDGGFDLKPRNLFFDWNISPFANAEVSLSTHSSEAENKSLHLAFVNSTKPYSHFHQFLRLPPGQFVLSGEWMASNLRAPAGLVWNMGCVETNVLAMQSQAFAETVPWSAFSAKITIPAEGCQTQRLQLMAASSAVLDAPIDGEYRFDNLKISIETPAAPAAQ
jgi:hypothetical protein